MGDHSTGLESLVNLITGQIPDIYVTSIRIGKNEEEDIFNSYFMNVNDQVDMVCQMLSDDPKLAKGFNFLGFSQGGQFARAVVQRCSLPVANLITFGAQHQGVFGFPRCPGSNETLCNLVRKMLSYGAYEGFVQDHVVQAQYWHDPNKEETYREKSIFLADINNEREVKQRYKDNLLKLEKFVMVLFTKDSFVQPIESETFGQYAPGQSSKVLPMEETELYKSDRIGLKTLNEQGKLKNYTVIGDHLKFTHEWFINTIVKNYLV
ncbi:palmitoyl-protein thioesterase 1-like isoform X2 [Brevipalpus obovatus]